MAVFNDTEYRCFRASLLRSLASVMVHISRIDTFTETGAIQAVRCLARSLDDVGHAQNTLREWLEVGYERATPEQQQTLAEAKELRLHVVGLKSAADAARSRNS